MDAPNQIVANTRTARARPRRPLRTLLFIVIILIVLIGISYAIFHTGYAQPLTIAPYPNATLVGTQGVPGADHTDYITTDDLMTVGRHYAAEIGQTDTQYCQEALDPAAPTNVPPTPIRVRCVIDQVTLGNEQIARITINPNPGNPKQTLITVDRTWPTN